MERRGESSREERWNAPEKVEQFAARDADHRLQRLIETYPRPEAVRVLDLGCAGGRNAELLAERGFDVWAVDIAEAMVTRTRERVARWLGDTEAQRRVLRGTMTELDVLPVSAFHLVVALGVYHQAETESEWEASIAETARVLVPDGQCLVSVFAPGTAFGGRELEKVPESRFLYESHRGGTLCLRTPEALDRDFLAHGLHIDVPSEVVIGTGGDSRRVTVNALYRKRRAA